ncbi:hypothetical protein Tcan_17122 [Toxocara canis]|uniref:Uncharacterized protein n=1 Tax=Toxocara canis TaxID=6265 RepID=A0A0B2UX35_TOXCA|nr:hypothetical protein Tcan_17122 [Toxocara canis]
MIFYILIILLLLFANVVLVYLYSTANEERTTLLAYKHFIDERKRYFHQWHCHYHLPPSESDAFNTSSVSNASLIFNTTLCAGNIGDEAVAFARQQVDYRGINCTKCYRRMCKDKIEMVSCHDDVQISRFAKLGIETFRTNSCVGFRGTLMPKALLSAETRVIVPRLRNEDVAKLKGRVVFSQELIYLCPRCMVVSGYYRDRRENADTKHRICRRLLLTLEKGWPDFARYCDAEELSRADAPNRVYC